MTPQPLVSETGDVLLWNGEIFDGLEVSPEPLTSANRADSCTRKVGEHENDGVKLLEKIQRLGPERFLEAIGPVEGPYAFVYFQAAQKRLWFGRDPLGRRSLLSCAPGDAGGFSLASNAPFTGVPGQDWQEVDCAAIHACSLTDWPAKMVDHHYVAVPDPARETDENSFREQESFARHYPSSASPQDPLVCHSTHPRRTDHGTN